MSADHARALDAVWGSLRPVTGDKLAQLASWKERLTDERLAAVDLNHGRAVYAKTCQRCHQLFDAGAAVGPGLTGSNRADLDYLRNLIDPSAEIPADYRAEIVATVDGRILTGVIARRLRTAGPLDRDRPARARQGRHRGAADGSQLPHARGPAGRPHRGGGRRPRGLPRQRLPGRAPPAPRRGGRVLRREDPDRLDGDPSSGRSRTA